MEPICIVCHHHVKSHEYVGGRDPWLCHACDDGSAGRENHIRTFHVPHDMWRDDDGVRFQLGAQTYGPYDTEEQASAELMSKREGL